MDENEAEKLEKNPDDGSVDHDLNVPAPKDMKHLDFITSLIIIGVSIYTIIEAHGYYVRFNREFYASPGFMPTIIAVALFFLAIHLMYQSLNKSSVKECFHRLIKAIPSGLTSKRFKNTIIGLTIFAVYIYILLRFLPFWLASIIMLFTCFIYLKAAKPVKSAIIAILSAIGIVLFFQVIFRVPMP